MKKIFFPIIIVLFALTGFAQKGVHFGFKGMPQTTWMFNSHNSDNANYRFIKTWGHAYGPSIDYHFKETVGIAIDVLISTQGQKFSVCRTCDDEPFYLKMRYVKLPLLLTFNTSADVPVMFVGQFGPQFGFLTKAEVRNDFDALIPTLDVKDEYKAVNIGWVLGFGIGFNLTDFLQLSLGMRFDFAFTDAEKKPEFPANATAATAADAASYYYYYPTDPKLDFRERPSTFNATGALEIGFKYILRTK